MKKTTHAYYTLKQGHIPVFLEEFLSVRDPVIAKTANFLLDTRIQYAIMDLNGFIHSIQGGFCL